MQMVINMRALLKMIKDMERAQTSSTTTTNHILTTTTSSTKTTTNLRPRGRIRTTTRQRTSAKGLRWTMGHPHQQAPAQPQHQQPQTQP
jgi:hypothetical protein